MDILLTHGYFLQEDEAEKRVMKPYPTLGILYISSYLKAKGFDVSVFDTTFGMKSDFYLFIDEQKPSGVGIYADLMTKLNVLEQIRCCHAPGSTVIGGGRDVPGYPGAYPRHGADVAGSGEGEATMAEV